MDGKYFVFIEKTIAYAVLAKVTSKHKTTKMSSLLLESGEQVKLPIPKTFPVKCKQEAVKIDGTHTEIVLLTFTDRHVLFITQTNKPGTITDAKVDFASMSDPMVMETQAALINSDAYTEPEQEEATCNVKVLFGKRAAFFSKDDDDSVQIDLEQILARHLLTLVKKPLLLNLALEKQFQTHILNKTQQGKQYLKALYAIVESVL